MLKADVRTAQEIFEELGYEKDEVSLPDKPIYTDKHRSLMFINNGVVIAGNFKQIVSLSTKEIEAINKQIKEMEQC